METVIARKYIVNIPECFDEFQTVKIIGQGAFSVIILITDMITEETYACKVISKEYLIATKAVERFQREVTVFSKLNHPNIVKLYRLVDDSANVYLIMEYCQNGDLYKFVSERGALTEAQARFYFAQLVSAVQHLHENGIAHRDLKPENILLDAALNVKLADFGFSNEVVENEMMKTQCGSPCYTAPEIIAGRTYEGTCADIWSLGIILYIMLTGSIPWDTTNEAQLFYQIQTAKFHIPDKVSENAKNLINRMLVSTPSMRLTATQIKSHPWFYENNIRTRSNPNSLVLPKVLHIVPDSSNTQKISMSPPKSFVQQRQKSNHLPSGHMPLVVRRQLAASERPA